MLRSFNFPGYVIHLEDRTNRLFLIKILSTVTDLSLNIFNAFNGSEWLTMPNKHPWKFDTLTQGMIGCTHSHLAILGRIQNSGTPHYIFEDDTEIIKSIESMNTFLQSIEESGLEWDIILLGANSYVDSEPVDEQICSVKRFWGTHAMLVNPRAVPHIRKVFESSIANGIFLPADWLYNETIKIHGLRVLGPANPTEFVRQAPGFVSAITGKLRI